MKSKHKRLDDLESKAGVSAGPKRTYVIDFSEDGSISHYWRDWQPGDQECVHRTPGGPYYMHVVPIDM